MNTFSKRTWSASIWNRSKQVWDRSKRVWTLSQSVPGSIWDRSELHRSQCEWALILQSTRKPLYLGLSSPAFRLMSALQESFQSILPLFLVWLLGRHSRIGNCFLEVLRCFWRWVLLGTRKAVSCIVHFENIRHSSVYNWLREK